MVNLRACSHRFLSLAPLVASLWSGPARAQAALDPSVAPRAAALERQGERGVATDLLGRYLATAPDDGGAWFQLGRFYLMDSREWHARGHVGEPSGVLYLDFAATALDQAIRLNVDSGVIFRGMVEMDRVLVVVEDQGWEGARVRPPHYDAPPLPGYIVELGVNLLNSCPVDGVLLTGSDLESVSVWYATFAARYRTDVLPLRPELYATDSVYRRRMANALKADPTLPVKQALATVAGRRPVCLSPLADPAAAPFTQWTPLRLVRVSGLAGDVVPQGLTVTDLLEAESQHDGPWTRDVERVYQAAARHNRLLCTGLLARLGDRPPNACGR